MGRFSWSYRRHCDHLYVFFVSHDSVMMKMALFETLRTYGSFAPMIAAMHDTNDSRRHFFYVLWYNKVGDTSQWIAHTMMVETCVCAYESAPSLRLLNRVPAGTKKERGYMERLQKVIAGAGVTSRRKAEDLIRAGRVTVNGKTATIGMQVDPDSDMIAIDGKRLKHDHKRIIVLYKPLYTVTTLSDPQGRKTVRDLITDIPERLYPVGRLDYMTSGVLLLTNDGGLTEKLLHPRYGIEKEYEARVDGQPTEHIMQRLKQGLLLDDGWVKVKYAGYRGQSVRIVITEGRKHIVRRLLAAVGLPVRELTRLRFANIGLEGLKPGMWRDVSPKEYATLKQLTSMSQTRHKSSL